MKDKFTLSFARGFQNRCNGRYGGYFNLKPGDRIIEPIFQTGFSKHHSIYLGTDANGEEWIAENDKFVGVRLIRAKHFFRNKSGVVFQKFTGNATERIAAIKRALSCLGKQYNLVNHNCEHYASYVQTGRTESKQVAIFFALLLSMLCLGHITSDSK